MEHNPQVLAMELRAIRQEFADLKAVQKAQGEILHGLVKQSAFARGVALSVLALGGAIGWLWDSMKALIFK